MNYNLIRKYKPIRVFLEWIWTLDAKNKYNRIKPYLSTNAKLLDFGSGLGTVTKLLREKGFEITPLDISDQSFFEDTTPVVYDGIRTGFPDSTFDQVLVLTVLHHIPNNELALAEARRIGKEVIIIEDVYKNLFQRYFTYFVDSLVNVEFKGHPHSNRTMGGWEKLFQSMGLKVKGKTSYRFLLFFRQVVYFLTRTDDALSK